MTAISSPCIKACMLDPVSKLCQGCGRSMAEIGRWGSMSEAERLAIMATLRERLKRCSVRSDQTSGAASP